MSLADQLRRFHAIVVGAAPLASAHALVEGDAVDAVDRMRVYVHAYTARIAGVLASDYPKLATLVPLREHVAAYLHAYPSRHPSLREVGAHLADYLTAQALPQHLVELARLERARLEAFDGGRDAMPLAREDLEALGPAAFPRVVLQLVPACRLVELTTNADDLWDAIESGAALPEVTATARSVLVWRRGVTVIHRTLARDEAALVRILAGGASFAEVCEPLADTETPAERAFELLLKWLDGGILDRTVALAANDRALSSS